MLIHVCFRDVLQHSHKKRIVWKHGAEMAVLRTYVENQAIPEPILLYLDLSSVWDPLAC